MAPAESEIEPVADVDTPGKGTERTEDARLATTLRTCSTAALDWAAWDRDGNVGSAETETEIATLGNTCVEGGGMTDEMRLSAELRICVTTTLS